MPIMRKRERERENSRKLECADEVYAKSQESQRKKESKKESKKERERFSGNKYSLFGEGRARKEFLNPLPGPKSRSAVCGYCHPWPFTLLI